jgi:hypothetical protein
MSNEILESTSVQIKSAYPIHIDTSSTVRVLRWEDGRIWARIETQQGEMTADMSALELIEVIALLTAALPQSPEELEMLNLEIAEIES